VRFLDVIGLALSSLWRRKLRALLTTLGVVFGTFVLVASLSVREGIKETVLRQYRRFGELRQVDVLPGPAAAAIPPKEVKLSGNVSPQRQRRLRQEIERHRPGPAEPPPGMTSEQLRSLAGLSHVVSVTPSLVLDCSASLGGKSEHAFVVAAQTNDDHFLGRLIYGTAPASDASGVLVSEYLLYRLGIVEDTAVAGVVGKKFRLEYQPIRPRRGLLMLLQSDTGRPSVEAEQLLKRLQEQLAAALPVLKLTEAEKAEVRKWLEPAKQAEEVVTQDFTVCGVLRSADLNEGGRWERGWQRREADVVLPVRVAEELYFRVPAHRRQGIGHATVEVDDLDNVKGVMERVRAEGLQARALLDALEREQYIYVMITSAMTLIALVALLVAGLGITNTMLMSVLERVRDIGIMKAVGARDADIRWPFLMEGALVGVIGGVLGLALARLAALPGDAWVRASVEQRLSVKLEESLFVFAPWLVLGAPLFACLVTTLAAYYPARRAAALSPVAALRYE
jgi:putative ABC transport system permease protein